MRLTRRAFIQVSTSAGGLLMAGMPLSAAPVTNAMVIRKAKQAGSSGRRMGVEHVPGLHPVVRHPGLRPGRPRRTGARQPR